MDQDNFVMLFKSQMDKLIRLGTDDPGARSLFDFILMKMGKNNALIASRRVMAKHLRCTERTISRRVDTLTERGLIQIVKSGASNIYLVNAKVAWSTGLDKRKRFMAFNATVIIEGGDNDGLISQDSRVLLSCKEAGTLTGPVLVDNM